MSYHASRLAAALICLVLANDGLAGPYIPAGDVALRQDIQLLADRGVIKGPVTTWPLAWGPIMADIRAVDSRAALAPDVQLALHRIRTRADWETRTDEIQYRASAAIAEDPTRIRGFENSPREQAEIDGGITWTGDRLSITIRGQAFDSPSDGEEFRADGSAIGIAIGNWTVAANTLDRWWGPGWDGSLILSNNARPIPSLSLDRNFTDPFDSKWLSWLGPWDLSVHYGQFETDRAIPNARFFGMRMNFRPLPALEIGLSRTAQWCGGGRPCGFDTFVDLLAGIDNRGGQGIDPDNEPGNQLAGFDARWSRPLFGFNTAFYGQMIGEDEAGGFPSRYLGLFGAEVSGVWRGRWSYRAFAEFAGTSCQFHESTEAFNCAYNHTIYQTGYRYRGRSVGHGADNDARLVSLGLSTLNSAGTEWRATLRLGALNRGGAPDPRNRLTPTREDIVSVDFSHRRLLPYGILDVGIGVEQIDHAVIGRSNEDFRGYVQWRTSH